LESCGIKQLTQGLRTNNGHIVSIDLYDRPTLLYGSLAKHNLWLLQKLLEHAMSDSTTTNLIMQLGQLLNRRPFAHQKHSFTSDIQQSMNDESTPILIRHAGDKKNWSQ
jgi:hypothetical protein